MNNDSSADSFAELISVREAASLVRVSESTIWRWINEDALPSYRVGRKRVYLKRGELTPLIQPARRKGSDMTELERHRLNLFPMALGRPDIDPVERALALHVKWRKEHGDARRPEAWEDINEMRDQRARELG